MAVSTATVCTATVNLQTDRHIARWRPQSSAAVDAITMTYRYEWRALRYAAFLTDDHPPFEFTPAAEDNGHQPNTVLTIANPEHLNRWKPLSKWALAIPHYVV